MLATASRLGVLGQVVDRQLPTPMAIGVLVIAGAMSQVDVDRALLAQDLRDALKRLYQDALLRVHPLAELPVGGVPFRCRRPSP
jgi:hypothetical protein